MHQADGYQATNRNAEWAKKSMYESLMKEQERIARSKASGKKKEINRRCMKALDDMEANKT
jgi:hypothetical protein